MTSSIRQLPLPYDEANAVEGWDETIDDADSNNHARSSLRTSLTPHAMAHEHLVCGIATSETSDTDWLAWKTSLAPHRVSQVVSNACGSLIAATLDNGTISILRGVDGKVLATRRVAPEGCQAAATIDFVKKPLGTSSSSSTNDASADTLVILPPVDGPPILVSNMQGHRLNNCENPGIVAEAARCMGLHALRLDNCDDIRAIRGLSLSDTMLRLALIDGNGKLAIYDYNLNDKTGHMIERELDLKHDSNKWELDMDVGLRIQSVPSDSAENIEERHYLVLSLYSQSTTKICWLDLRTLTTAAEYKVYHYPTSKRRTHLKAMETLPSCEPSSSLGLVLAVKYPSDTPKLETIVIQASVGDKTDSRSVHHPHLLYSIPVPPSVQSIALAAHSNRTPYSFRCKTWSGKGNFDCHTFHVDTGDISVGSIRLLASRGEFSAAQELVDEHSSINLESDSFSSFHPAEIALRRLQDLLRMGGWSNPSSMQESQECLQKLVKAGLTEDKKAQTVFLQALDSIISWPAGKAMQNPPSIDDARIVVKGAIAAIARVQTSFGASTDFQAKASAFKNRLEVLEYLQQVLPPSTGEQPSSLHRQFVSVRSIKDLFTALVQSKYFLEAENLWKSDLGSQLSSDSMVSSVLTLSSSVRPQHYSSLLSDIVFPSLSIGHELLPPLLSWACKLADGYDEPSVEGKQTSLDDAIFLLELIERSTKGLRLRVHSSFSSYTPFVERIGTKRRKILSRHGPNSSGDFDTSVHTAMSTQEGDSENSQTSKGDEWERPNPTILEMGRLQGGAQKARRQNFDQSYDAVDETEETVESKLAHARCLKHARAIGLDNCAVSLGTYVQCGGAEYIAKALIRNFSSGSTSHDERVEKLGVTVNLFCQQSGADFDEALISYSRDICRGKNTGRGAIEESSSIARCCINPKTKCLVTLITLRAALFCRFSPSWLSQLSKEAIVWAAGDSSLRSELEEASRLLLIDGIVGRYCGEGAKELFHVDNPRHAIRLLQFVAGQLNRDSILTDTLDLCDAFAHLSREDACSSIFQNVVLRSDDELGKRFFEQLFLRNAVLAQATFSRIILYCMDLLEENSSMRCKSMSNSSNISAAEKRFDDVLKCSLMFTELALSKLQMGGYTSGHRFSIVHFDETSLESLHENLKRIDSLQREFSIRFSLSTLRSPKNALNEVSDLLLPLAQSIMDELPSSTSHSITQAKRMCAILSEPCQIKDGSLWYAAVGATACNLAKQSKDQECLDFMSNIGLLKTLDQNVAARSALAVSLSFCMKALKYAEDIQTLQPAMRHIIMSLSLLQDNAIMLCPNELLDKTLSLTELCDMVTHVLVRTDEGVGEEMDSFRRDLQTKFTKKQQTLLAVSISKSTDVSICRKSLHSKWYIGDGLLLPPNETLSGSLRYCKAALRAPGKSDAAMMLQSFVDGRGAHALGLRLLSTTIASRLSTKEQDPSYFDLEQAVQQTTLAMAERYVGGTGNGITSGIIDSQLSVSCLLSLPLKMAFRVYRSSLPVAISTRDFARVATLANIGVSAGSGSMFSLCPVKPLQNWKRQSKFVIQCSELALRARWWKVLKEHDVKFDPNSFQEDSQSLRDKTKRSAKYVVSLIPALLVKLTKVHDNPEEVLRVLLNFADSFDVEANVPVQKFVEHLLSPVDTDQPRDTKGDDTRKKFGRITTVVRSLLRRLEDPVDRAMVLRKCLRRFEHEDTAGDYERLSLVLSLYQGELSAALQCPPGVEKSELKFSDQELELVDRRRDAVAILSSFFQGDQDAQRPPFSDFFPPLPDSWEGGYECYSIQPYNNLLGRENQDFDPVSPLNPVLMSSNGPNAAALLAPLCLPLGVPRGHIHARSLIGRFERSKSIGSTMPSFTAEVLPVLNRLKKVDDVATLAEWCSEQYVFLNEDKLPCLDFALSAALKASSELEARSVGNRGQKIEFSDGNLDFALERVKRLNAAKDLLADRLAINAILESVGMTEQSVVLTTVIKSLMFELEEQVWKKEVFTPETFVEVFLRESSNLASGAALCPSKALSIGQFRQLASLVNRACNSIAEKYSHVQVGRIARRLARRWLFHGDQIETHVLSPSSSSKPEGPEKLGNQQNTILSSIEEDDTINFVMDLNSLQQSSDTWKENLVGDDLEKTRLTSEEEPSSIKVDGSVREVSDIKSGTASLRIAFIMALSHENSTASRNDSPSNENDIPDHHNKKTRPRRLLSKLSARGSKQNNDSCLEHSKELLRIVFAKSVSAEWIIKDLDASMDSRVFGSVTEAKNETITFAMRHRALRAASVLCPQEVLEKVLDEEGLLSTSSSSLKKTAFAAFVAKEIEAMGLPLPHSDLAQLSTMHFPSYARTLWRHHRDERQTRGRLLLLIFEMYLKDSVSDTDFLFSILKEMDVAGLPRTLLLALDAIRTYVARISTNVEKQLFLERIGSTVNRLVGRLSTKIFKEIEGRSISTCTDMEEGENFADSSLLHTLERLALDVQIFSTGEIGQANVVRLLEHILTVTKDSPKSEVRLGPVACSLAKTIGNVDTRSKFLKELEARYPTLDLLLRQSSFADERTVLQADNLLDDEGVKQ